MTKVPRRLLAWILPWSVPLGVTAVAWILSSHLPKANFSMLYLAGVLITAVSTSVRPALICALLSFLAYNFFHTEPHFTFRMIHREDIITAGVMVVVAMVTAQLAARLREQVDELSESAQWQRRQTDAVQEFAASRDQHQLLSALARNVAALVDAGHVVGDEASGSYAKGSRLDYKTGLDAVEIFLCNADDTLAKQVVKFRPPLKSGQLRRIETLLELARLALQRLHLEKTLGEETLAREREQLRSALLSSISHDLRTPLATMIGSISSLLELHDALPPREQRELLDSALQEARRLDSYIQKLLDMTRIGRGELSLDRDWIGLDDILSVVIRRARQLSDSVAIEPCLHEPLPLLHVHPALIEQAIFNVVENAMRYAPTGTAVLIEARQDNERVQIEISDHGPGIPEKARDKVFDMFFSLSSGDGQRHGTGLGLAITQGIIGAHGGRVEVVSSGDRDGKTTIRIGLPVPPQEQTEPSDEQNPYH